MNPWTLVESKSIYRNPWIHVREDRVLRPDGRPGIYGVIEIPPSIAVLAVDEQDRLLLIGQWRYTRNKYSWEVPIGASHASDANIQDSAVRELREEAGVEAEHWTALGTLEASIGVTTDTQWLFSGHRLDPRRQHTGSRRTISPSNGFPSRTPCTWCCAERSVRLRPPRPS
jgi:8-oxo-dGTP pyrophosphatase MutT (NUDIX family)